MKKKKMLIIVKKINNEIKKVELNTLTEKLIQTRKNKPYVPKKNKHKWGVNNKGKKTYVGVEIDIKRTISRKLALKNNKMGRANNRKSTQMHYGKSTADDNMVFYPKYKDNIISATKKKSYKIVENALKKKILFDRHLKWYVGEELKKSIPEEFVITKLFNKN
jgi:hypothetical protein